MALWFIMDYTADVTYNGTTHLATGSITVEATPSWGNESVEWKMLNIDGEVINDDGDVILEIDHEYHGNLVDSIITVVSRDIESEAWDRMVENGDIVPGDFERLTSFDYGVSRNARRYN